MMYWKDNDADIGIYVLCINDIEICSMRDIAVSYSNYYQRNIKERFDRENCKYAFSMVFDGVGYMDSMLKSQTLPDAKKEMEEYIKNLIKGSIKFAERQIESYKKLLHDMEIKQQTGGTSPSTT